MLARTISFPDDDLAALADHQAEQVAGFVGTVAMGGLGAATSHVLRNVLIIVSAYDLSRLAADHGRQLAAIFEDGRTGIHDEFAGAVGAAPIDAGLDAAIALAEMIGRPWRELEAIPDTTLRQRVARVTILANVIENAAVAEHLAETRPAVGAPAGMLLN